jgi:hypothetical protein
MDLNLDEAELRQMPSDLRDSLLKWYFSRSPSNPPGNGASTPAAPISAVPKREETGRVSFLEFTRAGLLKQGDSLACRSLRRQRRSGGGQYIDAGKVLANGTVEYNGRSYDVPSKLAVAVVNGNGGKTAALNGYDYLFVRAPQGLVPLHELRDRFLKA